MSALVLLSDLRIPLYLREILDDSFYEGPKPFVGCSTVFPVSVVSFVCKYARDVTPICISDRLLDSGSEFLVMGLYVGTCGVSGFMKELFPLFDKPL